VGGLPAETVKRSMCRFAAEVMPAIVDRTPEAAGRPG
jgi:hypothetical protein